MYTTKTAAARIDVLIAEEARTRTGPHLPPEAGSVSGLSKAEAEDLLDWLQNNGCTRLQVVFEGPTFAVRCCCPRGTRLGRDGNGQVRLGRVESAGR